MNGLDFCSNHMKLYDKTVYKVTVRGPWMLSWFDISIDFFYRKFTDTILLCLFPQSWIENWTDMVYFRRHISFWKKNQWTVNKFIVTQCWNSFFHFINYNLVGTGMFLDGNLCFLINSKRGRCPLGIDQEIKHFFFWNRVSIFQLLWTSLMRNLSLPSLINVDGGWI